MIVESDIDLIKVQQALNAGPSFWIPMISDPYRHHTHNAISFIYIYSIVEDIDYIIPLRHFDCINLNTEQIQQLTSPHDIFVLAKKRFQNTYAKPCYDADLFAWWHTGRMLDLNNSNTPAHDMWSKWWHNETNTNDWLPITRHWERCVNMRQEFMKLYTAKDITDEYKTYDISVCKAFGNIEQHGIWQSNTQLAHTEYNLYTSTGRPSNKFGGVNYAALNKEDGSRKIFSSRFTKGMLVEYDYDAYHVRLIASLIRYTLPSGSVHTYFGKQYFDTNDLSEEQYEQSKQITFRLLYGGIDDDFAQIPFFNKVRQFINKLWKEFKLSGYITTPIYKRRLLRDNLHDMNANKLFNYLLQATETEHNIKQVLAVNNMLINYQSRLVFILMIHFYSILI